MDRRTFLAGGLAAGAAAASLTTPAAAQAAESKHTFKLKYAPHFGMFRNSAGNDPIDQLKFAADVGFRAWEDNGMPGKPVELQEKIAKAMQRLDIEMGVFVATASFGEPTMASGRKDLREKVLADMKNAVEVAKRVNAK